MSNIFEKRINYKPFEYPQLKELWELIEKTFWTVSEINFTADVNDYLVNLNSTEQSIFRKSLLGIAQIEVGVKTFWGKLYDYLPKPEINNLGSTYAHNESIHSEAYSELLSVLGLELEFANIRQIPALYNKYLFIEEKLNTNDIVDKTFFFTIGIENTSLFSLFSNILSFTRFKGLMKNTSNIIAWSSADEDCFHPDTEILTPTGWKNVMEFEISDDVIGFSDGKSRIEKVQKVIQKHYDDELYNIKTNNNEQFVTKGHDLIIKHNTRSWEKVEAFYFKPSSYTHFPLTSIFNNLGEINELSALDKIKIALQADGTKLYWENNNGEKLERGTKNGYNYSISLSRPQKLERFKKLLLESGIEYSMNPIKNTDKLLFRLRLDNDFNYKEFDWVNLSNKTNNWIVEFIDELKHWDGHIDKRTNQNITYCTTNKKCAELVMGLCTLINLRSHISISEDNRKESYKTSYRVYIQYNSKPTVTTKHFKIDKVDYIGMVGCITVPSGGLITKYNNKIAITGNCHARAGITILNIIFNENPKLKEKYTQEYVENLCKDYIKVEIELLDWIYSEGELGFFTKNDMINFMKYRLDGAIEKMGYSKIFNISNDDYKPMKWFDEEVYSNTLDDFFSRRPVDYTKKDKSFDVDDIFDDF